MVIEYIRYQVPAASHAEFLEAYRAAGEDLTASAHCVRHEISQGIEEPDNFIVRIEWNSIEAHEQGFRNSTEFRSFFAKVKPYFTNIREMKHYQLK